MSRPTILLALGVLLGVLTFATVYGVRTHGHRALCESVGIELAWIKQVFELT
jgi:hypothetical protein